MPKIIGSRKTPRFRRRPAYAQVPGRALLSALSTAQIYGFSSAPSGRAAVSGLLTSTAKSAITPSGKAAIVGCGSISSASSLGVIVVRCALAARPVITLFSSLFITGITPLSGAAFSASRSSGIFARLSVLTANAKLGVKAVAAATGKLPLAGKAAAAKVFGKVIPGFVVPLGIDGFASSSSTSSVVSAALTTAFTNDVIIAVIGNFGFGSAPVVFSVLGGALTWQKRFAQNFTDSNGIYSNIEEWYAISSSPLTAVSISATINNTNGVSESNIVLFGVKGANTLSPFDPNTSIPAAADTQFVDPAVTAISTTNSNDFIIGAVQGYQLKAGSPDTGFTRIAAIGGTNSGLDTEYDVVSATQSGITVSWTGTEDSVSSVMFVDAIRAFSILQALIAQGSIAIRSVANQASKAVMVAKARTKASANGTTFGIAGMIGSALSILRGTNSPSGVLPITASGTIMTKVIPAYIPIAIMTAKTAIQSALSSTLPMGTLVMSGAAKFVGASRQRFSGIAAVMGRGTSRMFGLGRAIGAAAVSGKAASQIKAVDTSMAGTTITAMATLAGLAVKARGALLGTVPVSGAAKAQGKAGGAPVGSGSLLASVFSVAKGKSSPRGAVPIAAKGALTLSGLIKMSPTASLLATCRSAVKSVGLASPSMALLGRAVTSVRAKTTIIAGASLASLARASSAAKGITSGTVGLLGAAAARAKALPGLSGSIAFAGRSFVAGKGRATTTYTSVLTSVVNVTARAKASQVGRLTLSGATKSVSAGRRVAISVTTNFLSIAGTSAAALKAFGSITLTFLPVPERTIAVARTRVIAVANRVRTLMAKW